MPRPDEGTWRRFVHKNKYWSIRVLGKALEVVSGTEGGPRLVGKPKRFRTEKAAAALAESVIQDRLEHGFIEVRRGQPPRSGAAPFRVARISALKRRFDLSFVSAHCLAQERDGQEARVYRRGLTLDHHWFQDYLAGEANGVNVIVEGDLTVAGTIHRATEGANFLLVTGNLRAQNLQMRDDVSVCVGGTLAVDNLVHGCDPSGSGSLTVGGEIQARLVYCDRLNLIARPGTVHAPVIGDPNSVPRSLLDHSLKSLKAVVHPDALTRRGSGLDFHSTRKRLEEGLPVLLPARDADQP